MAEVRDLVADLGAVCIFAEPQFNSAAARAIAEEAGAEVLFLDPVGDPAARVVQVGAAHVDVVRGKHRLDVLHDALGL